MGMKNIKTDAVVLGGGIAGCAAALAAARKGVKVTLIEGTGVLGGQAGFGLVTPYSAMTANNTNKPFGGIVTEIYDDVSRYSEKYCTNNPDEGGHWSVASPHIIKYLLLKKLTDAGVSVRFHSNFAEAHTDGDKIEYITVLEKDGFCDIYADIFIDASGDGDLFASAGADYVIGSEADVFSSLVENDLDKRHFSDSQYKRYEKDGVMQPVSIFFTMGGVDYEKASSFNNKSLHFGDLGITREMFEKWEFAGTYGFEITDDKIPTPQGRILVTRGTKSDVAVINMSRVVGIDGTDAESLNEGEIKAQLQLIAIVDFLQRFVPGFEKSYLIQSGSSLGIRETRRLKGKYVLTGNNAIRCREFDDAIARGSYIIDIHDPNGKGAAIGGDIKKDFYEIPYGCLVSEKFSNMLVCGRCISADHVAHASTRIQGTCVMTGQAAGTAAFTALKDNADVREIDGRALRKILISDGVYLD